MKKRLAIILGTIAALAMGIVSPALAGSFGLGVGFCPTSPSDPIKAFWTLGSPLYVAKYVPNTTIDYGLGQGWWAYFGQGMSYDVKVNGDELDREVKATILPASNLATGYEQMPLEFVQFDTASWIASPADGYKRVWFQVNIPDEPQYWDKKYQCEIEFSLLQEGGQVNLGYVFGDTVYILTDKTAPVIEPVPAPTPEPTPIVVQPKPKTKLQKLLEILKSRRGR